MRCHSFLLLFLAACTGLSADQKKQLAQCQESARVYYRDGKLEQALVTSERGLALEPKNYQLRSLHAATLLRQSGPANGSDQRLLDRSAKEFEQLYDERRPSRHERHVLFVYSLCRQKQGQRYSAEAVRADESARVATADAQRATTAGKAEDAEKAKQLAADRTAEAQTARERSVEECKAAAAMLEVLLERGEMQQLCHYHLMQISAELGDREAVFRHGDTYLQLAADGQKVLIENIDRTTVFEDEVKQKRDLQQLRDEEIEVRSYLGRLCFDAKDYDGALRHVNAILAADSTRSNDYYNRARILQKLNRTDEAKDDMRRFLTTTNLPPDSPRVLEATQALKQ